MKIKAYTYFSQTHTQLLKKLLNSFPWEPDLELNIKFLSQEGNGVYHNPGWKKVMARKILYIIDSLKEISENDYMLHLDSDIVFFKPVYSDLINLMGTTNADILFQNDRICLCAGCFISKKTNNTVKLFEAVLKNIDNYPDDQFALNGLIGSSGVKFGLLPNRYYSLGINNDKWDGNSELSIPSDISMLHANWCEGIETKLKLIKIVEERIKK
jgi:hypothetical protein